MAKPTLEISEARKQLTSLDERLKQDQVIYITRHNKDAFAMVDLNYLSAITETLRLLKNPEALRMIEMMKVYHSIQSLPVLTSPTPQFAE